VLTKIVIRRLLLVGPAGARRLNPPDRPHRDELPLKPRECRQLIIDDPGVGFRRHASHQRGEEVEPGPELGPQHVVVAVFASSPISTLCSPSGAKSNWMRRGVGVKATRWTVSLAPLGRFFATVMTIPL
jgi:hypothetical protein